MGYDDELNGPTVRTQRIIIISVLLTNVIGGTERHFHLHSDQRTFPGCIISGFCSYFGRVTFFKVNGGLLTFAEHEDVIWLHCGTRTVRSK